jgi:hypothetical protein
MPEAEDLKPDVLVLLAERRFDSKPLGSLRLQSNVGRPLRLEGEAPLLAPFARRRLVECTRLGVEFDEGSRLVTAALVKATYEICRTTSAEFNITGGRRAMRQFFRTLQYDELDGGPFPISFGSGIPHWIFVMPVREFETRLRAAGHWYHEFLFRTRHPDIDLDWDYALSTFDWS